MTDRTDAGLDREDENRGRQDRQDSFFEDNERLEDARAAQILDELSGSDVSDEDLDVPRDTWGTVRRLWDAARGQRWRFVIVVIDIVFYVITTVSATAYSAEVIDALWENVQIAFAEGRVYTMTWDTGGRELAIYFGLWMIATALYTLRTFIMAGFAETLNLALRKQIAEKLNRLPLRYFDDHRPGDVVTRATNDLDKMSEVLQSGVLMIMNYTGTIIGSIVMMFTMSPLLACIYLVFIFFSMVVTKVVSRKTLELAAERQHWVGKLTSMVEEAYSGRVIIRSFNQEQNSSAEFHALSDKLAETSRKADFVTNAVMPLVQFIVQLSQVVLAVAAGIMLAQGQLTVGTFQAFFQYISSTSRPLSQLSGIINNLQNALAAVERVFDLLDEPEMEPDPAEPLAVPADSPGAITFEHVRFGYTPGKTLMRDVSFDAAPGQKIAIVGQTGAGKTTLVNLLMRFYEVDGGRILLDGVDTREMTRAGLRSNFGMVLQDAWLFDGTIAENIAYGRPDATREEIVEAARMARVDFFVRTMPEGYDTRVGNDAENVSQGQRQLLTIARVILCDPKILILDEATSSVDTRTEQDITKAMQTLMAGRTTFVIAHRLSTIVDSDLILLMDGGSIVEQGTHEELLAARGAYWELYQSQFA